MNMISIDKKGFTLIELLVSVSIFVFMTAFLVVKYGTFNQSVLVTNAAYDTALTIRSAQSYGLNVKEVEDSNFLCPSVDGKDPVPASSFDQAYGAFFSAEEGSNTVFRLFSVPTCLMPLDSLPDPDESNVTILSNSTLKKGIEISDICTASSGLSVLDCTRASTYILFKRPNPDAIIKTFSSDGTIDSTNHNYVRITLLAPDGTKKNIEVRSTGQISIDN